MTPVNRKALSAPELAKRGLAWLDKPAADHNGRLVEGTPNIEGQTPNHTLRGAMRAFAEEGDVLATTTCPITYEPFKNPLLLTDGNVYEDAPIEKWLARKTTSPLTNTPMPQIRQGKVRAVRDLATAKLAQFARSNSTPAETMVEELKVLGALKPVSTSSREGDKAEATQPLAGDVAYLQVIGPEQSPRFEAEFARTLGTFVDSVRSLAFNTQIARVQARTAHNLAKSLYEQVEGMLSVCTPLGAEAAKFYSDRIIAYGQAGMKVADALTLLTFQSASVAQHHEASMEAAALADSASGSGTGRERLREAEGAFDTAVATFADVKQTMVEAMLFLSDARKLIGAQPISP